MKVPLFVVAMVLSTVFAASAEEIAEASSFGGTLQVGESQSVILYFGEESGDYAAVCFENKSEAGAKILAACADGEKCEITGEIDFEGGCKVPGLEADLSASGKLVSLESVKADGGAPAEEAVADTPEGLVKELYEAHANSASPFHQTEDRAAVDRYFTKPLADLIWKDAVTADGVGVLAFDPLFYAQDTEVTEFKIGEPEEAQGVIIVAVAFKNFGEATNIRYQLTKDEKEAWKIDDIRFQDGEMLKGMLDAGLTD